MKTIFSLIALATFSIASIAADLPPAHPQMPSGHGGAAAADMSKADAPLTRKGKVVSVLDAKQFTYIEVQDGKKTQWVVSPAIALKAGNAIRYANGDIMDKFHSKALNRDFTNVLFTTRVVIDK